MLYPVYLNMFLESTQPVVIQIIPSYDGKIEGTRDHLFSGTKEECHTYLQEKYPHLVEKFVQKYFTAS